MFDGILKYFGLKYAQFTFRKEIDVAQQFNGFLQNARKILIIMPVRYDDAQSVGAEFKKLNDKLENSNITIVVEGIRAAQLTENTKSRIIRLSQSHVNKFFLPRKLFLERVLESEYDVAIDLNLDFVLYAAYICRASNAKIRVGFSSDVADVFYNFQINIDKTKNAQEIYAQLIEYLKKF